jgi:hypothetical protein
MVAFAGVQLQPQAEPLRRGRLGRHVDAVRLELTRVFERPRRRDARDARRRATPLAALEVACQDPDHRAGLRNAADLAGHVVGDPIAQLGEVHGREEGAEVTARQRGGLAPGTPRHVQRLVVAECDVEERRRTLALGAAARLGVGRSGPWQQVPLRGSIPEPRRGGQANGLAPGVEHAVRHAHRDLPTPPVRRYAGRPLQLGAGRRVDHVGVRAVDRDERLGRHPRVRAVRDRDRNFATSPVRSWWP